MRTCDVCGAIITLLMCEVPPPEPDQPLDERPRPIFESWAELRLTKDDTVDANAPTWRTLCKHCAKEKPDKNPKRLVDVLHIWENTKAEYLAANK